METPLLRINRYVALQEPHTVQGGGAYYCKKWWVGLGDGRLAWVSRERGKAR